MLRVLFVDHDAKRIDQVTARLEQALGRALDMQVEGQTELAVGWLERQLYDVVLLAVDVAANWRANIASLKAAAGSVPIVLLVDQNFSDDGEDRQSLGVAAIFEISSNLLGDLAREIDAVITRWPLEMRLSSVEQQRDERAKLLELALAVVEKPVLIAGPDGEVTNASPLCADLFSGFAQELHGMALKELISEEDQDRFQSFACDLVDREWVDCERFRLTTQRAGETIPVRATAVNTEPDGAWMVLAFDDTISNKMGAKASDDTIGDVPVGLFQLLGLDDVRDALGESWPDVEQRVYAVVERVLDENLMVHDHFWRNHDGDYLVLFERCGRQEATNRARELVRRIKAAVIGAQDIREAVKGKYSLDQSQRAALGDVQLTISELPLEPDFVGREAEPFSIIEKKLQARRASERDLLRTKLMALKSQLLARHSPARTRAGASSPLVLLDLGTHHRQQLAAMIRQADGDSELLIEIDAFLINLHAELLLRVDEPQNTLAVVDVHAAGLASKRGRDHYRERCSTLPSALHGRFVFNIIGVEPGTYAPRLRQMAASLVPLARFAGIQLTKAKPEAVNLKEAGIHLVACDYAEIAPILATRPELFSLFLRYVHGQGARLIVRFVPPTVERETADWSAIDLLSNC